MKNSATSILPSVCLCVLMAACASPVPKKPDVLNIYELPRAGQGQTIYIGPSDNDMYYIQPRGYNGCAQISDAPSCSGGG